MTVSEARKWIIVWSIVITGACSEYAWASSGPEVKCSDKFISLKCVHAQGMRPRSNQ